MRVTVAHQKVLELLTHYSQNSLGLPPGHVVWIFWIYDINNPWGKDGTVLAKDDVFVKVTTKDRLKEQMRGRQILAAFIENDIEADKYQLILNCQAQLRNLGISTLIHYFNDYGNCQHDAIINGTKFSECRYCRRRLEFRDWHWVCT